MRSLSVLTPVQGVVLYDGPSLLDGQPIVAIATGLHRPSANRKTGAMVQTFILRADIAPVEAMQSGADASICGNCPHRPTNRGACYVNVGQSPTAVWHANRRGQYPAMAPGHLEAFTGRAIRFGAYGDPAAVPYDVWQPLLEVAARWTGYTHQWRACSAAYRGFLMASCDSLADFHEARAAGWRTFRIRTAEGSLLPGEFTCPASDEAGKRTTCERCGACNGTRLDRRPLAGNPVIVVHGAKAQRFHAAG